jgi:hypothetical protein
MMGGVRTAWRWYTHPLVQPGHDEGAGHDEGVSVPPRPNFARFV